MIPAISCDNCGRRSQVGDTRINPDGTIHRRRRCHSCRHRWFTTEVRRADLESLKAQLHLAHVLADSRDALIEELIARLESQDGGPLPGETSPTPVPLDL